MLWLLNAAAPVVGQILPETATTPTRVLSTSQGFALTLADPTAEVLQLRGQIKLSSQDFPMPVVVSNRTVVLESATAPELATLDFGGSVGVWVIASDATLVIRDLILQGAALTAQGNVSGVNVTKDQVLWPSVTFAPGSVLNLTNTITRYVDPFSFGNCSTYTAFVTGQLKTVYGSTTRVLNPEPNSIYIQGTTSVLLNVTTRNVTVGSVEITGTNVTSTCIKDATTGRGGGFPAWGIVILVLGIVLVLGLIGSALAIVYVMRRFRQQNRESAAAASNAFLLGSASHKERADGGAMTNTDSTTLPDDEKPSRDYDPVDRMELGRRLSDAGGSGRGSVRGACESGGVVTNMRSRSGSGGLGTGSGEVRALGDYHQHLLKMRLEGGLEGIEMGPILGRGSYGRVYKGRWKGALVAIKIVEHSLKGAGAAEIEGARESLLAASISHPNVVACYKICTVKINRTASDDERDSFEVDAQRMAASTSQDSATSARRSVERAGSLKRGSSVELLSGADELAEERKRSLERARSLESLPRVGASPGWRGGASLDRRISQELQAGTSVDQRPSQELRAASVDRRPSLELNNAPVRYGVEGFKPLLPQGLETIPSVSQDLERSSPHVIVDIRDATAQQVAASGGPQRQPSPLSPIRSDVSRLTAGARQLLENERPADDVATLSGSEEIAAAAEPMEVEVIETGGLDPNDHEQGAIIETWMLLEYADRGSLEQAINAGRFKKKRAQNLDMGSICRTLQDVATGMSYLHGLGIVHGDLKPANVLLKSTVTDIRGFLCKLADFGLSRIMDLGATHISTQTFGTVPYMPPELLRAGKLTKAVDVYSFGILMWQLYHGEPPFKGMQMGQVIYSVVNTDMRPEPAPDMPDGYRALMLRCWQADPDMRPTFEGVIAELTAMAQHQAPEAAAAAVVAASPRAAAASAAGAAFQPSPFVTSAAAKRQERLSAESTAGDGQARVSLSVDAQQMVVAEQQEQQHQPPLQEDARAAPGQGISLSPAPVVAPATPFAATPFATAPPTLPGGGGATGGEGLSLHPEGSLPMPAAGAAENLRTAASTQSSLSSAARTASTRSERSLAGSEAGSEGRGPLGAVSALARRLRQSFTTDRSGGSGDRPPMVPKAGTPVGSPPRNRGAAGQGLAAAAADRRPPPELPREGSGLNPAPSQALTEPSLLGAPSESPSVYESAREHSSTDSQDVSSVVRGMLRSNSAQLDSAAAVVRQEAVSESQKFLQQRYLNSLVTDTARVGPQPQALAPRHSTQAHKERFARLVRKSEEQGGPLRYSIEMRRPAAERRSRSFDTVRPLPAAQGGAHGGKGTTQEAPAGTVAGQAAHRLMREGH